MHYNNLNILFALLLFSGCASSPEHSIPGHQDTNHAVTKPDTESVQLYRKGLIALQANNYQDAELFFLKVIKNQPELAGPWANLAIIYIKQDNLEKALSNTQHALARNPNMPQAHNLMGLLDLKMNNITTAHKHFLNAISLKQDYAEAHYNLALLYDNYHQDLEKSIKHYELYLGYIQKPDTETVHWVEELKRNLHKRQSL